MTRMTRRNLFGLSVLATAGLATGCTDDAASSDTPAVASGAGTLDWWDHFSSFQTLNDDWAATQSTALGVKVVHTYSDAGKADQALQLAHQANKMPAVYSNVVGIPLAALVDGNWVHEIKLSEADLAKLPKGTMTDGITSLDGKIYGVPMLSMRQSSTLTWMNTDHLRRAGLDPTEPPTDYAGFKDFCRRLAAVKAIPLTMALGGDGGRAEEQVNELAQVAGFAGSEGLKFSGEYAYHDDSYLTVIEFLKELYEQKYLLPGSNTLDVVNARTRFAAGAVAMFVDGNFSPGGCKAIEPTFVDKMAFGPILVPTAGTDPWTYRGSPSPTYFVSKGVDDLQAAQGLVDSLLTEEYQKGMIAAMDQPPLNLDLVADNPDATDAYKQGVAFVRDNVFLMPEAIVRNPEIAAVDAKRKPVSPTLGNIVQGYLVDAITDLRGALKKLSDSNEADRQQAIKAARQSGAKVSEDDYVFSDWVPGKDYH
ncbi:ABC transporter substrate-binding protein [Microlunatus soli]|uniref:Extracellular solute-binding protein n=1 Tax=Microlunatus soli TaxID=630515 RepID=A0A1H1WDV4_9ACTN|nr:ABC transporter substrate-binding protein [Microlunatus soli]SDS94546.1 extracellular solute-binding protein [Microlunatus soli]